MIMNLNEFLEAAHDGVVTVVFRKVNGDLRTMPCTLSSDYIKGEYDASNAKKNDKVQSVWCVDAEGWRSFRIENVEQWYKGYPDEAA
jgi:hypothetical protein